MGLYPHPQEYKVLDGDAPAPEWDQWFEQLKAQANQGTHPGAIQEVSATDGITLPFTDTNITIRTQGDTPGIVDITKNPQIAPGFDGQFIKIEQQNATHKIKLDDGKGLSLTGGASITISDNDSLGLQYNKSKGLWIEHNRSIK